MGEIADMMLEGFLDEETGEVIDEESPGYPRRMSDRKQDRAFRAATPKATLSCVHPGCARKFRHATNYGDFLAHYSQAHGKGSSK